jgi:hypothetical protein
MKIHGNDELLKGLPTDKRFASNTPAASGFGDILKQTLERAPLTGPASATHAAIQLRPIETTPNGAVAQRLEGFLDLLDGYCQKLSSSQVSLKGLEPAVKQLEQDRDALSPMLGLLPENDGLKDILNRALVTASLEIIRFRRGDYLPD